MWAIDLGTTNTGVARWSEEEGRPRLVELPDICRRPGSDDHLEAPLLVPSVTQVYESLGFWARLGRWKPIAKSMFLGKQAQIGRPAMEMNAGQVRPSYATSFKPFLGRAPLRSVARVGKRPVSARDVARLFVRELLVEVKETTGERIRDVVVTTPVDSYESYRAELSAIFKAYGVRRIRFLDEPVAAAIGYGLGLKQNRLAVVVDFGGGTLDVALVSLTAKGVQEGSCEVLGKEGRPIGGNLVDRWLLSDFCEQLGYPFPDLTDGEPKAFWGRMMLQETCRVKEAVFFKSAETFLPTPPDELHRFEERIRGESSTLNVTREDVIRVLEQQGLYEALGECIDGVLQQAEKHGISEKDIEDVLMVGGSTLLPGVYPVFEQRFGRDVVRAWQPFEAVAYGAAAFAADQSNQSDFIVHDYAFVTHDLNTHEKQYSVIVPHGTRFPTSSDFWKRQLVPTCSLGEPETMFKLVICEVGRDYVGDRKFAWDAEGRLHKLGGGRGEENSEPLVVPLNESNPTLGYLKPPHPPSDKRPRLEIAFGVNTERWLCATVYDLRTKKYMMREEPVVRLL
ncbi:MAG: Hsp70 family protein [Deltaproteobacteria bacterium]|jgi:molecular chaperone DnaK (HSP70)